MNDNEYLNFINNNNLLSKCTKDKIIECLKNKNTVYIDALNNFQMNHYYKNADIKMIHYLYDLLLHFTNTKTIDIILKRLKSKKQISDSIIIELIYKSREADEFHYNKNIGCTKWDFALQNLAQKCFSLFKMDKFKYLDIGCGTCKKSVMFGKYLKLDYNSIHGCDIPKWGPYEQSKKKPLQFSLIQNNKLLYDDNYFQVVTVIFTLHHIESLKIFLKEIFRIIKPGGYLIIIEHDSYNDYDKILLDFEHKIYGVIYDKRKNYCENPDYMITYNRYEWNYILSKVGFKYVYDDVLYFDTERTIRYDKPFYSFYQK